MSCLYSSPEVNSPEVTSLELPSSSPLRPDARPAHLVAAPSHSTPILSYVAVDKDAVPQPSARCWLHHIIRPANTSTAFSREFSSAISGFRSLCGRKQRSSLSHRAQVTCVSEPFTQGGLSLENSGLRP